MVQLKAVSQTHEAYSHVACFILTLTVHNVAWGLKSFYACLRWTLLKVATLFHLKASYVCIKLSITLTKRLGMNRAFLCQNHVHLQILHHMPSMIMFKIQKYLFFQIVSYSD